MTLNIDAEIEPLIHRLNASQALEKGSIVTFISARTGEGTTTVSQAFAWALHEGLGKRVLFVTNDEVGTGLVEASLSGKPLDEALNREDEGFFIANWVSSAKGRAQAGRFSQDKAFWKSLRDAFDLIVIDAPALREATDGVVYAQASNATILVIEAEKTRKQVAEHLRDTLSLAGAKIVGVVLNKRKFYIPASVYSRL